MKICVVGVGAIGGILCVKLAKAGHEVSAIARGAHLQAIRDSGLTLVSHADVGRRDVVRIAADSDPARLAHLTGTVDVVMVGLKANALGAVLPTIAPLLRADTVVVPAINGVPWWYFLGEPGRHSGAVVRAVDPQGVLTGLFAAQQIIGCVVHAAGEVRQPGEVHHTGGKRFFLGEIERGLANPLTARVVALAAALNDAGLEGIAAPDIRYEVWAKLIGNLSFNPIAALTNSLMNQICGNEGLLDIIRSMLVEGMRVAKAYGCEIRMTPDERIDVARFLGGAKISMHQDFEARRAPEVDAVVGAVIELAGWEGIEVPTVRMIDALVRARAVNLGLLSP
jgi:2-dehydropantoate 2-reductase